jgi:hypothetical protein
MTGRAIKIKNPVKLGNKKRYASHCWSGRHLAHQRLTAGAGWRWSVAIVRSFGNGGFCGGMVMIEFSRDVGVIGHAAAQPTTPILFFPCPLLYFG